VALTARALVRRSIEVDGPADRVWDGVVDWPRHGAWVPLTTVAVLTPAATGVGARFVGRTALPGPLRRIGFDDVMEVVAWEPPTTDRPGRCEVVKQGRVVRGSAWFEVHPRGAGRSRVTWGEDVLVPAPLAPLVRAVAGAGLARVLRAMARDLGERR